tara:strand:- start:239 stop:1546 length:1308 start_codon:yes stop_codon:yes gene_type:complete
MNKISKKYSKNIYNFSKKLFPICRSLTGDGNRKTLRLIKEKIPKLNIHEIKSGSKVFDWKVPKEWNVKNAYVIGPENKRVIDFKNNNLHLVSYSIPIKKKMSLNKLKKKLHINNQLKDAIPYVCSYYKKDWGFCLSQKDYKKLKKGTYQVRIDSFLKNGSMTYADLIIKGKSKKEILLTTYICHPSMGNNEVSGPALLTYLANYIYKIKDRKYTYRLVFAPENIGSIVYIKKNLKKLKQNVIAAYNITCVGDNKKYSFLYSKIGSSLSDTVGLQAIDKIRKKFKFYQFLEFSGSDERRYNSPGVDIPMSSIMRSKYGSYKEYHTSKDNLKFISQKGFQGSFDIYKNIIDIFERSIFYKIKTICEPQLGKRNLYPIISKWPNKNYKKLVGNMNSFLSLADGKHNIEEIAKKIQIKNKDLKQIIKKLEKYKLIEKKI